MRNRSERECLSESVIWITTLNMFAKVDRSSGCLLEINLRSFMFPRVERTLRASLMTLLMIVILANPCNVFDWVFGSTHITLKLFCVLSVLCICKELEDLDDQLLEAGCKTDDDRAQMIKKWGEEFPSWGEEYHVEGWANRHPIIGATWRGCCLALIGIKLFTVFA